VAEAPARRPAGAIVRTVGRLALAVAAALLAAGCGTAASNGPSGGDRLGVVTTTTVLADLVGRVGGDRVAVSALVPKGGEVHTYDPRPSDVAAVASARIVFANGLGLDAWLAGLARDAGTSATIVELAANLEGVTYLGGGDAGAVNPHLWMDPTLAVRYVDRIREALSAADPAGAAAYATNAAGVTASLGELDTWARARFDTIPATDRRIVSLHDAFPYFARAYGLDVVGIVVPVPGQDPSAGDIAGLIATIRSADVRAILSEVQFPTTLVDQIARETGTHVVANLYSDSLGDPPVDTYDGLIRWDVDRIVEALSR
jgi:ABC-type Zn uptake system ZnuABC Zn-binding protein ZnuA